LGSDDEHFIFIVAACARPMMAGEAASHVTATVDDCRNSRRLTDTGFMVFPPERVFLRRYWFAAVRLSLVVNV
jgi:hypothetical protein